MTFPPKVLGLVTCCEECRHYTYDSGGVYQCDLVGEPVTDYSAIAPFCPLSDYPSRLLAQMQRTIWALREPQSGVFGTLLMTHVATRLKLNLHANGSGVTILLKDRGQDREVHLQLDYIQEVRVQPLEITFMSLSGDGTFKLLPDTNPPLLRESDKEGKLWREHRL